MTNNMIVQKVNEQYQGWVPCRVRNQNFNLYTGLIPKYCIFPAQVNAPRMPYKSLCIEIRFHDPALFRPEFFKYLHAKLRFTFATFTKLWFTGVTHASSRNEDSVSRFAPSWNKTPSRFWRKHSSQNNSARCFITHVGLHMVAVMHLWVRVVDTEDNRSLMQDPSAISRATTYCNSKQKLNSLSLNQSD
jgi:hypothetical protein